MKPAPHGNSARNRAFFFVAQRKMIRSCLIYHKSGTNAGDSNVGVEINSAVAATDSRTVYLCGISDND